MAPTLVPRSTTTDTGQQVRFVDNLMTNVSARDTVLTQLLTVGKAATNTKVEWFEDTLLATSTTATPAITTTTATTIAVASGTGDNFQFGHVIQIDSEQMWVDQEPVAGSDVLHVVRGYAGTTAATHLNNATVQLVDTAFPQNVDAPRGGTTVKTTNYNIVQQWVKSVQVSDMQMRTGLYAQEENDLDYETGKKMIEAKIEFELSLFYGQRNDWGATPGHLGGLNYWLTSGNGATVTNLSTAALTYNDIQKTVRGIYDQVGARNMGNLTLLCNSFLKEKIGSLFTGIPFSGTTATTGAVRLNGMNMGADETVGLTVKRIHTDFADLNLVMAKFCPTNTIYILSMDNIKIVPYAGGQWRFQTLPVGGPYQKTMLVGQYTLQVKAIKTHGIITNVSITS